MEKILWEVWTILVNTIPSMVLTYIPFKNKLKYSKLIVFLFNAILFIVYMGIYILITKSNSSYVFLQAYKLALTVPGVLIAFLAIDESNYKIFYFNLTMITYIVICAKLANYFIYNNYNDPTSFEHAIINTVVFVITLPLMVIYQNHLYKITDQAVEVSGTSIWKIIWLIPFLFILLCLSTNWNFNPDTVRQPQFIVINIMTAMGMFISNIVLSQIIKMATETFLLKENTKKAEQQLLMQGEQYKSLVENIATTNAARHDLRHHLSVIKMYSEQDDHKALEKYVDEYLKILGGNSNDFYCENIAANAIVKYYCSMAKNYGIDIDIDIKIPEKIGVKNLDLSVILGNCLENAIEACNRTANAKNPYIKLKTRLEGKTLAIIIINSFDGQVYMKNNEYMSRKHSGKGIGLSSVDIAAKKYGGTALFESNEDQFKVSVMLFLKDTHID